MRSRRKPGDDRKDNEENMGRTMRKPGGKHEIKEETISTGGKQGDQEDNKEKYDQQEENMR